MVFGVLGSDPKKVRHIGNQKQITRNNIFECKILYFADCKILSEKTCHFCILNFAKTENLQLTKLSDTELGATSMH